MPRRQVGMTHRPAELCMMIKLGKRKLLQGISYHNPKWQCFERGGKNLVMLLLTSVPSDFVDDVQKKMAWVGKIYEE